MSKFVDLHGSVPTPSRYPPHPTGRRSFSPDGLRREASTVSAQPNRAQSNAAKIRLLKMGNPAILLKGVQNDELRYGNDELTDDTPLFALFMGSG